MLEAGNLTDPEYEAALRTTLGKTYTELNRYASANHHLERALVHVQRRPRSPVDQADRDPVRPSNQQMELTERRASRGGSAVHLQVVGWT